MSRYAISLARAGWIATDCKARRVALTGLRRAAYAYTALTLFAVLASLAQR